MIEVSAPGKLYIAGEYAVVEPGHPAIIVAVDQFITVSLEQTKHVGSITSFQYGNLPILWRRHNDQLVLDKRENPFHYILAAITVTEKYAKELNKELAFFSITIDSELDSSNGRKYGLGSSAAVTVATIKALCQFYNLDSNDELVFKLAALAHLSVKSNGSCGDVAASVYGGWIAFTTFDRDWVASQQKKEQYSIKELIDNDWPLLSIKPLTPPRDLRLVIGWTGSPASTSDLVDEVTNQRNRDKNAYDNFLKDSKQCVNQMIEGFQHNDIQMIQQQIRKNRELLIKMSQDTGVIIETPALTQLCNVAEQYHGAAKSSGAGGGDCGIVLFNRREGLLPLMTAWEKEGITNLPLHVYTNK
ncbi:phosphomevalonate kinase [Carnobacterium iners]|uniref:phosphomevalonate kinase n=1 Tax=Carnobacterium iners TaxID=1073423 RepID=A0A1X7N4C8_9LACT|nr:phosphomevalonate kinase [Carnobacterium iners]SEK62631.1 phosphomevalonate kinase [Carnobacterium iners]SMH31723.1 phosphomevalonate kinase [Carnobacterium iners]